MAGLHHLFLIYMEMMVAVQQSGVVVCWCFVGCLEVDRVSCVFQVYMCVTSAHPACRSLCVCVTGGPWLGYVICLFLIYTCMTLAIQQTSATTVNVSILSADFYALLFGLFLFHYKVC